MINTLVQELINKNLNLSGPIEKTSSLTVGRRLRVAALITATNIISKIKPMNETDRSCSKKSFFL